MPDLKLDFVVLQTNSVMNMTVFDISTYPISPVVTNPTIVITVPSFGDVSRTFITSTYNVFDSTNLGITILGQEIPLPDGIYTLRYYVDPEEETYVEHSIIRVAQLEEKYYQAFLTLDMMECDGAIKKQSFVQLNSIYFFIQGAVAAANNCATVEANKLYKQANNMLDNFINQGCGCNGNNYLKNF
jgi:hypothetical protein